jgi:uncharacterized membrane protein YphA (DoxX/SURF4 family)
MSLNAKYPRVVAHQQQALACIRIGIGLCFLWMVAGKLNPNWVTAIAKVLEHSAQTVTTPGYATFLKEIVLPMGPALAYAVILGELTVGICLVLGLFTALLAGASTGALYVALKTVTALVLRGKACLLVPAIRFSLTNSHRALATPMETTILVKAF